MKHKDDFVHFQSTEERENVAWPSLAAELKQTLTANAKNDSAAISNDIRNLSKTHSGDSYTFAFLSVLADLADQRTNFEITKNGLWLERSEITKDVIKQQLLARRDASLAEKSVQDFLNRCESPSKKAKTKSIRNIIHDGEELANQIEKVASDNVEFEAVIKPKLEIVTAGAKDTVTGLPLTDIWRYCRLTWSLEYQSVPGRQMGFLVRNIAHPNKPIMGIGSLASPVLQHSLRDDWIGWTTDSIASDIVSGKREVDWLVKHLLKTVNYSTEQVFYDDFNLSAGDINEPLEVAWASLDKIQASASDDRIAMLKSEKADDYRKKVTPENMTAAELVAHAKEPLWRKKRAGRLSGLLKAKNALQRAARIELPFEQINFLFNDKTGLSALNFVLGELRTIGTSSRVVDLNVCGAIPPYNHLMGGKLVALLSGSQEMQVGYSKRYKTSVSEISSFIAAKPVYRPTNLEVITTTSLYGKNTVQYNGLNLTTDKFVDMKCDLKWEKLGLTVGEGTFHLSNSTSTALREYGRQRSGYREVNNVFGEGTSPKLRNIRQSLLSLGFSPDRILKHKQERLFLGCVLNDKAKERLLDFKTTSASRKNSVDILAQCWKEKWVLKKIQKPGAIEDIKSESFERLAASLRTESYDEQFKLL